MKVKEIQVDYFGYKKQGKNKIKSIIDDNIFIKLVELEEIID